MAFFIFDFLKFKYCLQIFSNLLNNLINILADNIMLNLYSIN